MKSKLLLAASMAGLLGGNHYLCEIDGKVKSKGKVANKPKKKQWYTVDSEEVKRMGK
jgi:hypothetical protein